VPPNRVRRILSIDGNIDAAVDFVLDIVQRSVYVSGVFGEGDAIVWLNQLRPYDSWIQTVVRYYNGCDPELCARWRSKSSSTSIPSLRASSAD
jgi:hypothetical protein